MSESLNMTFLAAWYREDAFCEVERRAVFSRMWILVLQSLQFTEPGHYVRSDMSDCPFLMVRDRQGPINASLAVCRHRAFPVVHQDYLDQKAFGESTWMFLPALALSGRNSSWKLILRSVHHVTHLLVALHLIQVPILPRETYKRLMPSGYFEAP